MLFRSVSAHPDPVVAYLEKQPGLVIQQTDNKVYVACPWKKDHGKSDADMTQTVWFKAGTNGFECGHFQCLDSVCAGYASTQFLDAIGYLTDGFSDEPDAGERYPRVTPAEEAASQSSSQSLRALGVVVDQVLPGGPR